MASGSSSCPRLLLSLRRFWRQRNMSSSSAALSPWAPSVTSRLVFQEITAQTQRDNVIWYVPRRGEDGLGDLCSLSAESPNPLTHPRCPPCGVQNCLEADKGTIRPFFIYLPALLSVEETDFILKQGETLKAFKTKKWTQTVLLKNLAPVTAN